MQAGKLVLPKAQRRWMLQTSFLIAATDRANLNASVERFAQRVPRVTDPYNALQPFTTKALRNAEL
jgi:hypothetical protein